MAKGPGLFSDIGKKARDLLHKDYQTEHKLTISAVPVTYTQVITRSGCSEILSEHKGNLLVVEKIFLRDVTCQSLSDLKSNICTTITYDDLEPGLKTKLSFVGPLQRSGKVEVQYLHENAGISTSIGLAAKPLVNFSGVAGNNIVSLGTDISFDTSTGNFTKYNAGLSFSSADLIVSFALNDKFDTLTASYMHTVSPLTNTAVGAELTYRFSSNENTLTMGMQHTLDPLTSVKARVNNYGVASALIQHAWNPNCLVTVSGEVDTRDIEKSGKVGIALALTV